MSSIDPQPDPNTHLEAWTRYVTTDHYVLGHLLYSILGLIFAIFALGAYLTRSSVGGMGLVAMVITVLGNALFLPLQGVSTFSAPEEGQAVLAGLEEFEERMAWSVLRRPSYDLARRTSENCVMVKFTEYSFYVLRE